MDRPARHFHAMARNDLRADDRPPGAGGRPGRNACATPRTGFFRSRRAPPDPVIAGMAFR
jgi:hypothetical protein